MSVPCVSDMTKDAGGGSDQLPHLRPSPVCHLGAEPGKLALIRVYNSFTPFSHLMHLCVADLNGSVTRLLRAR